MIRILVVDDHPALRAGLSALLRSEPGLVPVAAAADVDEALDAARRTEPDLAVIDYSLGSEDGLMLCLKLKSLPRPPRVLMYSAFADGRLAVAARVAGGDGLVDKAAPPAELFEAVRQAARGLGPLVTPPLAAHREVAVRLATQHELAIFGMRLQGSPLADIAQALQLRPAELGDRLTALVARLRSIVDGPGGPDA
jgi:DNA-binding NarL/FixJ family response regulator